MTSGKVRTEQRSPVAGGDIFGQHAGVAAPGCQPPLSSGCRGCGQGGGRRASRSRPALLPLAEREEGERDGGVERSQEPGHRGAVTALNKTDLVLTRGHVLSHTHALLCRVKIEQERAAGYTLSFWRRVTVQECHLSTGASGVKCDITLRLTQIALGLLK